MIASLSWRVEEGGRNAWPALREVFLDGWLLRFSDGLSRRANSANPLHARPEISAQLVAEIAALYERHGQPAIFRLPSLIAPRIDEELRALDYTSEGESVVLHGPIDRLHREAPSTVVEAGGEAKVRLASEPDAVWVAAMARLQGYTEAEAATYGAIIGRIAVPAAFAALLVEGEILALAYGVLHRELLRVQSMITDPRRRRSGYAGRVLRVLAAWGEKRGAGRLCLEVDAANAPARALYEACGIDTELYRYHYRRAPAAGRGGPGTEV